MNKDQRLLEEAYMKVQESFQDRLKKAKDVEGKEAVDVYIVPEEDIPEETIIK